MSELQLIPAASIAFVVTVAFMIALHPVAESIGLVDKPGGRKAHVGEVPIIGGLAMFVGVLSGVATLGAFHGTTMGFAFAFFLLVLIGAFDDKFAVPAIVRILVQVAAILIVAFGSDQFLFSLGNPFGLGEILLGPFAIVGTLVVAVTVINAYNLVDGVDGLAGILALIAFTAVAVVGSGHTFTTTVAVVFAASIIGFLIFNFPVIANRRMRSFMGDAGSTFLGFAVFWTTLGVSQGEAAVISPVVGLWFAAIPIFDSLTCFVRRLAARRSPFSPGRDHFHHTLKRGGFGVRQTLGILSGLQAVYVVVAIIGNYLSIPDVALFALWSIVGLSQRSVIKGVSKRHRLYLFRQLRAGKLGPYRAARARALN